MSGDPLQRMRELRTAVLAYVGRFPEASDTFEGIQR
jgi:hypothetical protein